MYSRKLSGSLKQCAAALSCTMIASLGAGLQYSKINAVAANRR